MSGKKIHILLVEDNPDHAELLRRDLELFPLPNHLHHVADGEAALRALLDRFPSTHDIEVRQAGLEEAFLELTTDALEVDHEALEVS